MSLKFALAVNALRHNSLGVFVLEKITHLHYLVSGFENHIRWSISPLTAICRKYLFILKIVGYRDVIYINKKKKWKEGLLDIEHFGLLVLFHFIKFYSHITRGRWKHTEEEAFLCQGDKSHSLCKLLCSCRVCHSFLWASPMDGARKYFLEGPQCKK